MSGPYWVGVDVGSAWAKAVVVGEGGVPCGRSLVSTGLDLSGAGNRALDEACAEGGVSPSSVASVASTGYGRDGVLGTKRTRSEILCLSRGAHALIGGAMTVVDIGGQDNKVVFLDEAGHRTDYRMNRKCAAGTGSFLDIVCLRMGVSVEQLADLADQTAEAAPLSSFCSVFAATEVLDLLRKGYGVEAIARGVYRSVAQRVVEMGPCGPLLALAGGVVAHHPPLVELVRQMTALPVEVLPHPQHVGALGAALLAMEGEADEGQGTADEGLGASDEGRTRDQGREARGL